MSATKLSSRLPRTRRCGLPNAFFAAAAATAAIGLLFLMTIRAQGQELEPIEPLPLEQRLDAKKVALGEALFNDPRLSRTGREACATCHHIRQGGADSVPKSIGINGALLAVNTPTVFNSSLNFRLNWNGRSDSLEAQAAAAIGDPAILNSSVAVVVAKLLSDSQLATKFDGSYPSGLNASNLLDAISTFERSLITPNARFDRYLRGDKSALTQDEADGYRLFKSNGCVACHQGANIGGNMFQVLGVVGARGAYFAARGNLTAADLGRFNLTHDDNDKFVFRVPSLRNVALTAPYLHDGSAATLEQVVRVMFKYQLGRAAQVRDVDLIVAFLKTLTGEYKGRSLANPEFAAGVRGPSP